MNDILTMELPILLNLEKTKIKNIERDAKRATAITNNSGNDKGEMKTITNRGGR